MFEAFKRYSDFQGRASRSEYWLFALLIWLVAIAFSVLAALFRAVGGELLASVAYVAFGVFILGSFVPSLAVGFRRLHDTNRSAWWLLVALIPFLGGIVLLVFHVLPGTPGPNRFGASRQATAGLQETFA